MSLPFITFLLALGLAAVYLLVGAMDFLGGTPRSIWLSAAGGAAVAYIFLHLLPELAAAHARKGVDSEIIYFVVALAGLVAFYGIERRVRRHTEGEGGEAPREIFWLHVGSFATYNLIIGYLLLNLDTDGLAPLILYTGALGLHFLSSAYGMRLDHRHSYDATARWVLAAAVLLGWLTGWLVQVPRMWLDGLFAFLVGGVMLNVMKEELPYERQSRFGAFVLGVAAYGSLLLAAT